MLMGVYQSNHQPTLYNVNSIITSHNKYSNSSMEEFSNVGFGYALSTSSAIPVLVVHSKGFFNSTN